LKAARSPRADLELLLSSLLPWGPLVARSCSSAPGDEPDCRGCSRLPVLRRFSTARSQSVFGRLAGYEDVNDAEGLSRDPAMRTIVGREGLDRAAASSSQMGRFETE
jgi:Transposase DDE domain group 1